MLTWPFDEKFDSLQLLRKTPASEKESYGLIPHMYLFTCINLIQPVAEFTFYPALEQFKVHSLLNYYETVK